MEESILPRVTIVTPSYNQGQFIEETILSIINQNYPNLEYIIMDGGSTDKTVEIIKVYEKYLAYWVSEPDEGQSDAINKGFRMATGDILAWLNSDDCYFPNAIQIAVEFFRKHNDIGCIYGDVIQIDAESNKLNIVKSIGYNFKMHLYGASLIPQPASFFRKEVIDKVGYLDTTLHYQMDFDFFVRMGKMGIRFANIPKPLASFRVHPSGKTISQYNQHVKPINRIIKNRYRKKTFPKYETLDNFWLWLLQKVYRFKAFMIRATTRCQGIPFKSKFIRKLILK